MGEVGDQLRPSDMVPNSDFGMADRETQIQQRAVVLWQERTHFPKRLDLSPWEIISRLWSGPNGGFSDPQLVACPRSRSNNFLAFTGVWKQIHKPIETAENHGELVLTQPISGRQGGNRIFPK